MKGILPAGQIYRPGRTRYGFFIDGTGTGKRITDTAYDDGPVSTPDRGPFYPSSAITVTRNDLVTERSTIPEQGITPP